MGNCLDRSENLRLDKVTTLDNLASGSIGGLSSVSEELGQVELGRLEDLGLSDVDVVERVDTLRVSTVPRDGIVSRSLVPRAWLRRLADCPTHLGGLLNLPSNALRNKLLHELLELGTLSLPLHDLDHLGSDLSDLRRLGVRRLLDLVLRSLGETNGEQSENVAVGGSDVDRGLDERLPLSDDRSELVGGEVHAEERGEAALAGDLLDPQLDLPERLLLVVVEVGERELNDSALERVIGVF